MRRCVVVREFPDVSVDRSAYSFTVTKSFFLHWIFFLQLIRFAEHQVLLLVN